jgi:hypothetical protein
LRTRQPKIPFASEFIEERKYLKNVTTKTLAWYEESFRAFDGALDSKQTINQRIVDLRTRGDFGHLCQHVATLYQCLLEVDGV